MINRFACVVVLLAACRIGAKPSATPGDSAPSSLGAAPAQFSDLAPGDTGAVVAMMRQTMSSIDAGLPSQTQRDTTVADAADSLVRHLTVWLQDGVPRKLIVMDSSTNGQGNRETDVWFMGGDVAVLLQVADAYAFDSDRIVLWTDETLQPRGDVASDLVMAKQSQLIGAVGQWLALLGLKSP